MDDLQARKVGSVNNIMDSIQSTIDMVGINCLRFAGVSRHMIACSKQAGVHRTNTFKCCSLLV